MTDMSFHKLLPQNTEAEASLLSGIIINNSTLPDVIDLVSPEDFYIPKHGIIFKAILALYSKKEPADLVTLVNFLREQENLKEVGGAAYLATLLDTVPLAVNAPHYANIIKKKAVRREIIKTAQEMANRAYIEDEPDEILSSASKSISLLGLNQTRKARNAKECMSGARQRFEARMSGNKNMFVVKSGFPSLDKFIEGFGGGDLITIAARTRHGKTSLAASMFLNIVSDNIPALFFSLEMSEAAFIDNRILPIKSGLSSYQIKNPVSKIKDAGDRFMLDNAIEATEMFPMFIDDSPTPHYSHIVKQIRYYVREYGVRIVFIDQLSFLKGDTVHNRPDKEIQSITRALKGAAKELNIPIVILAQINRNVELRGDKRPTLADLKDSSSIEEDSDLVLFIYRESVDKMQSVSEFGKRIPNDKAEIIIGKQRNGFQVKIDENIYFNQITTKVYEV